MKILKNHPLDSYNSFGIKAKAAFFAEAHTRNDIRNFIRTQLSILPQQLFILGGGSNTLFTCDFQGCVLKVSTQGISIIGETKDHVFVKAEAGEDWCSFVRYCVEKNWGGIENLSLIPGNIGSSPIQNIGAYGVEMRDCIDSLEAISTDNGAIRVFTKEECGFAYRTSVFKNELKGKYIILSVTFRLSKNPITNTLYGSIVAELQAMGVKNAGISDIANAVIRIRQKKLPDPKDIGNAGSFFKNPTVTAFDYYRLKNEFHEIVAFNQNDGSYKLAAGWLIEQCGWKGYRKGDAGVHKEQSLIIVNYGEASGKEILALSKQIQASVEEKFAVKLEVEVNIIN